MSDPAAFQLQHIVQFERTVYDRMNEETDGAALDIVAIYLEVAPSRRVEIARAAEERNFQELERLAHMVKSGARGVGLLRLGALCEAIERGASAKTIDCEAAKQDFLREYDAAIAILEQLGRE
jgi:HPt (histidine-containing phosphotransfer) domain-containing protein